MARVDARARGKVINKLEVIVTDNTNRQKKERMKPIFRCGTKKAFDELAEELNLPNVLTMQDWSYEVSNPDHLDKYITHYILTTDDDKKFVLMEMMLQAIVAQPNKEQLMICWGKVHPILKADFKIHEYTVEYWKNLRDNEFENCKILSPLLVQLWKTTNLNYGD